MSGKRKIPRLFRETITTLARNGEPTGLTPKRVAREVQHYFNEVINKRIPDHFETHLRRALRHGVDTGIIILRSGKYRLTKQKRRLQHIDSMDLIQEAKCKRKRRYVKHLKTRCKGSRRRRRRRSRCSSSDDSGSTDGETKKNNRIDKEKSSDEDNNTKRAEKHRLVKKDSNPEVPEKKRRIRKKKSLETVEKRLNWQQHDRKSPSKNTRGIKYVNSNNEANEDISDEHVHEMLKAKENDSGSQTSSGDSKSKSNPNAE